MPPITFDGRSFLVAGRRTTLFGGGLEYVMQAEHDRRDRLDSLVRLGFNTVVASCPWFLHEPTAGRFDFEGRLDVGRFLREAQEAGLHVVLRIGPAIGAPFDGSGLPTWVGERSDIEPRTGTPAFLELVSRWFSRLSKEIVDLQGDRDEGGPLVAIQVEHGWNCGSKASGDAYLVELVRYARERGITVPILTSNGFWQETEGAIETWSGWDDLFSNLRQVASLQPGKPRICTIERPATSAFRRPGSSPTAASAGDLADRTVRALAAGAQTMVAHAVDGVLPAGAAGRDATGDIAPNAFAHPLLDEVGDPTEIGRSMSMIARFARDFGGVLADLDPDDQPMVVDPDDPAPGLVAVPRSGGAGSTTFFFRKGGTESASVIDGSGRRITADFGDRDWTWTLADADLAGRGRLDWTSAMPLALVGGRLLVLTAAAGSEVELSIDGRPLSTTAPRARRDGSGPVVESHAGFTVVVLNEIQCGTMLDDGDGIVIGASRVFQDGSAIPHDGMKPFRIAADGTRTSILEHDSSRAGRRMVRKWRTWSEPDCRSLDHPRSVPVDEDLGLASIGSGLAHAWFTARLSVPSTRPGRFLLLGGLRDGDCWVDGTKVTDVEDGAITIPAKSPGREIALFLRHTSRSVDGIHHPGDGDRPGALVAVEPLKDVVDATVEIDPIDPFETTAFIPEAADGEQTVAEAIEYKFNHRRKSSVILEIGPGSAGVVVINGITSKTFGRHGLRMVMSGKDDSAFKSGSNTIRIARLEHAAEDGDQPTVLFSEVVAEVVPATGWRLRRWESTPDPRIGSWVDTSASEHAGPRWLRGEVRIPGTRTGSERSGRLRVEGVTRGRIRMNGFDLGGYALREPGGRTTRGANSVELPIPAVVLAANGPIELLFFDEAGAEPSKVTVEY
ncbi:MAG: hypothetical protein GY885_16975 [Phycisphaeraceae bacterium]|nr:hypothetical protein [Phycisphaeraceae bacterium]